MGREFQTTPSAAVKNLKAMAEFCLNQKVVGEYESQSVVTPGCEQADVELPSEQITVTDTLF